MLPFPLSEDSPRIFIYWPVAMAYFIPSNHHGIPENKMSTLLMSKLARRHPKPVAKAESWKSVRVLATPTPFLTICHWMQSYNSESILPSSQLWAILYLAVKISASPSPGKSREAEFLLCLPFLSPSDLPPLSYFLRHGLQSMPSLNC